MKPHGMASPLAVVAALVVLADITPCLAANGHNLVSRQLPKCASNGERCAGEEGKPFVEFVECCNKTNWCMKKPNATADEWGMYCFPATDLNQCYTTGDRCMGAPNFPYVQYLKCCMDTDECVADSSLGWGSFCKPKNAQGARADLLSSCYNTGERCKGATGFPYVPYRNCCQPSDECQKSAFRGWGSFCLPSSNSSSRDSHPSYGNATPSGTGARDASSQYNYADPQKIYGGVQKSAGPAYSAFLATGVGSISTNKSYEFQLSGGFSGYNSSQSGKRESFSVSTRAPCQTATTSALGTSVGTSMSTTTCSPLPPQSPFCAARQDDAVADGRLILTASVDPAIPGRSNDIDIRISRSPCCETNLTARSLKLGDAMLLESTVCAEAEKLAFVTPTECMTNKIASGSILVGISIIFPEGTNFNFADFVAMLNRLLPSIFGFNVDVSLRLSGTAPPTTTQSATMSVLSTSTSATSRSLASASTTTTSESSPTNTAPPSSTSSSILQSSTLTLSSTLQSSTPDSSSMLQSSTPTST